MKNTMYVKNNINKLYILILSASLLIGCNETSLKIMKKQQIKKDKNPNLSLTFLELDMRAAASDANYVSVAALQHGQSGYEMWRIKNTNIFFHQRGEVGKYEVHQINSGPWDSNKFAYILKDTVQIDLNQPSVRFLGSFQYKKIDTDIKPPQTHMSYADLVPMDGTKEIELLRQMLKADWVKDTQWPARIEARIVELEQQKK